MGEDSIKRNHQERMQDGVRIFQCQNKSIKMSMQAKAQNIGAVKTIGSIRKKETQQASRKKVKKYEEISLKEEKLLAQVENREVTRKDVIVLYKIEKNDDKAIAIG